jgi:hypothetical protein
VAGWEAGGGLAGRVGHRKTSAPDPAVASALIGCAIPANALLGLGHLHRTRRSRRSEAEGLREPTCYLVASTGNIRCSNFVPGYMT